MSWDAWLTKDCGITECEEPLHCFGDWNYTHNTNGMARQALCGVEDPPPLYSTRGSWWKTLDGMNGADGARFLNQIIMAMESDPETYIAMNPPNGWGDYHTFLGVLRDMYKASLTECPTIWGTCG